MKISLIALLACCAMAGNANARNDDPGVHPPQFCLADDPGVHPPQTALTDDPGVHPPQFAQSR